MTHLIYLHGFASSAGGRKAQYLHPRLAERTDVTFHAVEFSPTPADFEYLTITGMINRLRQYILDRELTDVCLIGSSMGGLIALNYAHRYGNVAHLLLLSPALTYLSGERVGLSLDQWQADGVGELFHYGFNRPVRLRYDLEVDGRFYQTPPPPPGPITIIHGTEDEVVPIAASRNYVQAYPDQVQLIEVTAGHDINAYLPLVWQTLQQVCLPG
ncbi:MAG: YqiA/YcfP family alpha/beta fold hydrolase [Chloroflexota bacterium]